MAAYPDSAYQDVTAMYAGMLAPQGQVQDFQGQAWQGAQFGRSLYFSPPMPGVPLMPGVIDQLAAAKKMAAAQAATQEIRTLPGGYAGTPRPLIIDGSTLFGNTANLSPVIVANADLLVNTYNVQTNYKVILDPEDPIQQVMLRPFDSTAVTALYIEGSVKVDVAEAATGDGDTIFLQQSAIFDPTRNFAAGDRFSRRWERRWVADSTDIIRTSLRIPVVGALTSPVDGAASVLGHRTRVWKLD